jgi:ABC-type uncharacterized transport system permease subunit
MTFRISNSVFRILRAFWRINVAEELQYRANFVASVLGTVFYMVTALLTLSLFFRHTSQLGVGTTGRSSCCSACSMP